MLVRRLTPQFTCRCRAGRDRGTGEGARRGSRAEPGRSSIVPVRHGACDTEPDISWSGNRARRGRRPRSQRERCWSPTSTAHWSTRHLVTRLGLSTANNTDARDECGGERAARHGRTQIPVQPSHDRTVGGILLLVQLRGHSLLAVLAVATVASMLRQDAHSGRPGRNGRESALQPGPPGGQMRRARGDVGKGDDAGDAIKQPAQPRAACRPRDQPRDLRQLRTLCGRYRRHRRAQANRGPRPLCTSRCASSGPRTPSVIPSVGVVPCWL